jgi:hypothetical protein
MGTIVAEIAARPADPRIARQSARQGRVAYNARMNPTTPRPIAALALGLCLAMPVQAQVAPAETPREAASPRDRIERITHEDKLTRIDEVRVGGQTQSIDVQPKNGAPAYQIQPDNGAANAGDIGGKRSGNAGRSSWRLFNF